jgi:hypothetical protein
MVEGSLQRALEMTVRFRPQLDALVAGLLEHETLDAADVQRIFGPPAGIVRDPEAGIEPQLPQTVEALRDEQAAVVGGSND